MRSELAVRPAPPGRNLRGAERAAVLLLSLGEEHGAAIWSQLDEIEVREISLAMSRLGAISPEMMEELIIDFVTRLSSRGTLSGNVESTERLLASFLPSERVAAIMEEIRGPAGRNMWEKLSNVQEAVLANYLKNEYPQTVAVVLSKVRPEHAARVLAILPDEFSLDVMRRMLAIESVQKDILDRVEQTLRVDFMANLSQSHRRDAHGMMAEIFNSFDRQTEARFISALEDADREAAERIKSLMFTFDDLNRLDAASIQTLLRHAPRDKLTIGLKGASQSTRETFLKHMSQRAGKLLLDDIAALGPVRLRDVDEAQSHLVTLAKDLAAKGEIMISKARADDEIVL